MERFTEKLQKKYNKNTAITVYELREKPDKH